MMSIEFCRMMYLELGFLIIFYPLAFVSFTWHSSPFAASKPCVPQYAHAGTRVCAHTLTLTQHTCSHMHRHPCAHTHATRTLTLYIHTHSDTAHHHAPSRTHTHIFTHSCTTPNHAYTDIYQTHTHTYAQNPHSHIHTHSTYSTNKLFKYPTGH